jgi:hypothetical protein
MKKAELYLIGIALVLIILRSFNLSGFAFLTICSLVTISIFYFIFSFYLFNDYSWRDIIKMRTYKSNGIVYSTVSIIGGKVLSITIIGILFQVMHWEKAHFMSIGTLFTHLSYSLIVLLFWFFSKKLYLKAILIRMIPIGFIAIVLFLTGNFV